MSRGRIGTVSTAVCSPCRAVTDDSRILEWLFRVPLNTSAESVDPNVAGGLYTQYELRQAIGSGSFATVYKAVERETGKWRAVKMINKTRFMRNPKSQQMLQREVSIMQGLDHPFIVKLVNGFEDHENLWLVMELVKGGDLLDFITDKEGLCAHASLLPSPVLCE